MNKKLLITLIAGLLLLSAVSCGSDDPEESGTAGGTLGTGDGYIDFDGTDTNGNPIINETTASEPQFDPSEENPTFADKTMKVVVFTWNANLRSSTVVSAETVAGGAKEGDILNVTGESTNWYRLDSGLYIAKTAAADAAALEGFTEVNEQVTVTGSVNFRSYPSADTNSIRGSLAKDAVVTRVAKGESWSLVTCTVTVKNEDGEDEKVEKNYYVHNKYLQGNSDTTTAEETTLPEA